MTGGEFSGAIAVGIDLQDGDRIGERREGRIQCERVAEMRPALPLSVSGGGAARNDSGGSRCLRSAEVTAESIADVGW
jgi:hypothetical protein